MIKQENKISIIGSGFSSLSAACYLAKYGYQVVVYEKNETVGGRARQYLNDGFTFDIGPTWYWMPDVFEKFFADFGKKPSDYYKLEKLSPAYQVILVIMIVLLFLTIFKKYVMFSKKKKKVVPNT